LFQKTLKSLGNSQFIEMTEKRSKTLHNTDFGIKFESMNSPKEGTTKMVINVIIKTEFLNINNRVM
jgi:hypothetical protein